MNNNLILGGGGSDLIEPRAGENFIDGDAWLDTNITFGEERSDKLEPFIKRIFDRTIKTTDLKIERRIQTATGGQDTVVYSVDRADATLTSLPDGLVRVETDGNDPSVDVLRNIEQLQFNDVVVDITDGVVDGDPEPGIPLSVALSSTNVPVVGGELTATVVGSIPTGSEVTFELQIMRLDADNTPFGTTTQSNTTGKFTFTKAEAGFPVQVVATVTGVDGAPTQFISERTNGELSAVEAPTATATEPTVDTSKRTVTIPAVDGVAYAIDGFRKPAGTYNLTTQVTVTAEADSSSWNVAPKTWKYDLRAAVTPAQPVFNASANTVAIPSKDGVTYFVDGVAKPEGTHSYAGKGTVTAKAASDSHKLTGTASWTFDNWNSVTPTKPVFNESKNTVTIPTKTGVAYFINGSAKKAGTYTDTGTGTVTAKVAPGAEKLTGTTSWTFDNRNAVTPTKPLVSASGNTVKIRRRRVSPTTSTGRPRRPERTPTPARAPSPPRRPAARTSWPERRRGSSTTGTR